MKRIQAPAIKQALLTLAIGEVRAFEALSVGEPITSEALTKRIEKLTRAQRRFTWRFVKTAKRRFVTVLVAIILLFVLSLSITAVRETVFNFVTKTFLTHTDFYISGDGEKPSLDTIAVYKKPSWLPDGYVEKGHTQTPNSSYYLFENDTVQIEFYQYILNYQVTLDTENSNFQRIHTTKGLLYANEKYNSRTFLWLDDSYSYELYCPAVVDIDTVIRIIESIE